MNRVWMSDNGHAPGQVAVYLDFDNIVISRYDELHGPDSYRKDNPRRHTPPTAIKQKLAEAKLDLDAIIDYASSFGTVVISRAYANWADPVNQAYGPDLMKRSVDLVQLFPMSGTKNGADIRLAIDVIDDLSRYEGVTHVVVVAGDSDYVALAQRSKRLGRRVIGVGAGSSVGKYWRLACDEFRYYGTLPGVRAPESGRSEVPAPSANSPARPPETSELLTRALRLVSDKSTVDRLAASGVKVQMQRLDPTFTEAGLGFKNFTDFLRSQTDLVDVETGSSGTFVRWKSASPSTGSAIG